MGVFTDILASRKSFSSSDRVYQELEKYKASTADPAIPAAFEAADEVQVIAAYATDATAGTFTLTLNIRGLPAITTAAIAYDAGAATVEAAIDTACDGVVPGFTAGDIAVTAEATDLTDGSLTLTFSGDSVSGTDHGQTTIDGTSLTDVVLDDPAESTTTSGQPARQAWAVLKALGVITDATPPPQAAIVNATAGSNLLRVRPRFIMELAQEAAYEDGTSASYDAIVSILAPDHVPLVQG